MKTILIILFGLLMLALTAAVLTSIIADPLTAALKP